ncbi:MAG: hypothetical protein AB1921_18630, partial [Thermodesulfobacteriota bacterium]
MKNNKGIRGRRGKGMRLAALLASAFLCMSAGAYAAPVAVDLASDADLLVYGGESMDMMTGGSGRNTAALDINGDGIKDLVLVAYNADGPSNVRTQDGEVYIFYGKTDLGGVRDVAGTSGAVPDVIIYGANAGDGIGYASKLAYGDVNGDGITDLLLQAPWGDGPGGVRGDCGEIAIIYGSASLPAVIDLANGEQDVIIYGRRVSDLLGHSGGLRVADVNGDGMNDIIAGSYLADGPGNARSSCGEVYVIYGSDSLPAAIDLANGDQNVTIYGATSSDMMKLMDVAPAGDVNGDGIADIVLGANAADGPAEGRTSAGEVYVVFGSATLPATIDLNTSGEDVTIYGANASDGLGISSNVIVKDVSGDGLDDIIMVSTNASAPGGRTNSGMAYIVYGAAVMPATVDLAASEQDVVIYGANSMDLINYYGGWAVGDVNG